MTARLATALLLLTAALHGACGSEQRNPPQPAPSAEPELVPHDRPDHHAACDPTRRFDGHTGDACRFDSDCMACGCEPVSRAAQARRGGTAECERFNVPPAREECVATNGPACCDGVCVLVR